MKLRYWLYKKAFDENRFFVTVNADGLTGLYSKMFGVDEDKFYLVYDSMGNNKGISAVYKKKDYVFCGGKMQRDYDCFARVVRRCPQIQFKAVFLEHFITDEMRSLKNLEVYHDIPFDVYYKLQNEAKVTCIPLNADTPCGLYTMQHAALTDTVIVSTDTMSMRTVIPSDDYGYLCDRGDDKTMAERVSFLMTHEAERQSMARHAKNNMEKFKPREVAKQLADAMFSVAKRTGMKIK